jgi:hypothetical protein
MRLDLGVIGYSADVINFWPPGSLFFKGVSLNGPYEYY